MKMLAPPLSLPTVWIPEAGVSRVLARLPGPGTAASASGESTNHSEAARLADPGPEEVRSPHGC